MNHIKMLLKREYWEHRGGFLWAPVWTAGFFLVVTLMGWIWAEFIGSGKFNGSVHIGVPLKSLMQKIPAEDIGKLGIGLDISLAGFWMVIQIVLFFVLFFYLIGALYDDRKDRSVLFWKSLPVSDLQTVLSKVLTAAFVAPLIAFVVTVAMNLGFLLLLSLVAGVHGINPLNVVWGPAEPLNLWAKMLVMVPVNALWALPAIGWLLLASSFARSKPFVWAVLVPVMIGVLITWVDMFQGFRVPDTWYWTHGVGRILGSLVPGSWVWTRDIESAIQFNDQGPVELLRWDVIGHTLASLELWLGAVVGIAMIAGAVYYRRWREVAD
jgi:ABC-2 type transport system permease protein